MVGPTGAKNVYKARTLKRTSIKQSSGKSLMKVIDKEENFNFGPYTFVHIRIHSVKIFEEVSSEVTLVPQSLVL